MQSVFKMYQKYGWLQKFESEAEQIREQFTIEALNYWWLPESKRKWPVNLYNGVSLDNTEELIELASTFVVRLRWNSENEQNRKWIGNKEFKSQKQNKKRKQKDSDDE